MKSAILYRIAGVLLVVFAAGNVLALLRFWHVAGLMSPVHFPVGHRPFTYAQVVFGLGLFLSFCVLLGAYLSWHLSTLARTSPRAIGAMGWVLFAYEIVAVYASRLALSGLVLGLSLIIAICTGWANLLLKSETRATAVAKQTPGSASGVSS
jgi:hypothetical protein